MKSCILWGLFYCVYVLASGSEFSMSWLAFWCVFPLLLALLCVMLVIGSIGIACLVAKRDLYSWVHARLSVYENFGTDKSHALIKALKDLFVEFDEIKEGDE